MTRKTVNVRTARRSFTLLIAAGALGVLAGCAPTPDWMEWTKGSRPCPSTSLSKKNISYPLKFLSRGDERHVTLSDLGAACGVMPENMELIDDHEVGVVFTATVPDAEGKSGLGKRLHWIDVPVYVGVIDKKGKMIDRRDYEFSMTISDESTWSRQRVAYPLPSHIAPNDPNYSVVVGLGGSGHRASSANPLDEPKASHHRDGKPKNQSISALLPTSLAAKRVSSPSPAPSSLSKVTEAEGSQSVTEAPVAAEKIKTQEEISKEIIPPQAPQAPSAPAEPLELAKEPVAPAKDQLPEKMQIAAPEKPSEKMTEKPAEKPAENVAEKVPEKVKEMPKESPKALPREEIKEKIKEAIPSKGISSEESDSIPKPSTL